jgi:DNA-directed RNA polymerase subunit RPC12/RpoP
MRHECQFELDTIDDELRCTVCGVLDGTVDPVTEYLHSKCGECGREFESEFASDSICADCLGEWGMHSVSLDNKESENSAYL